MERNIVVAKGAEESLLLGEMSNRHGLIAGATGTGKSVTLKVLAEGFSAMGVPVFMADVKGDLAGICKAGELTPKFSDRCKNMGIEVPHFRGFPVLFWDVFGKLGHPVRTTVSEMGPLLLSRLLNLNEVQSSVLTVAFKVADDEGLLLLDLKDLQAILQNIGEHAQELTLEYGNVSSASIGAIQRALLTLREQGGEKFFGEPALNIDDLMQTDSDGRGIISILAADSLMQYPKVYSTLLLWLLSELFERLPEVGDLEKPKMVFFFDEAHLLFDEAPKVLLEKVEQVVRLIRSKGVGVYFVSQNPLDIPDKVLAQLGNRVQHALRAFTAADQKAVRASAENFRSDGKIDVEKALTELAVGEALVSLLDAKGTPGVVQRAFVVPPQSRMGAISQEERQSVLSNSIVAGHYEQAVDRESAYEKLKNKTANAATGSGATSGSAESSGPGFWGKLAGVAGAVGAIGAAGANSRRQSPFQAMITSAVRSIGSQLGRQLVRGVLGSMSGKR